MNNELVLAKYIRLSLDDSKSESMSIINQRALLDRHIANMDLSTATIIEFVDNGYSGTNYERPAIQELIELVRQGKVNCIIVKDMSRFGRNMIDTGYYLERIFPLYRVRFISVCDDYDSNDYIGDTGGMDVALKYLIHEQYSRDLSKKIKSAFLSRALRGERVSKNCAFGYMKVNKKLEIDESAAETVRLIFNLAYNGKCNEDICKQLYEEKRPTPGLYKKRKRNGGYIWQSSCIKNILKDEQYIGTYIAGKTRTRDIGSDITEVVDESEWIKIPDHHPAIIENDLFYAVQSRNVKKSKTISESKTNTSKGQCEDKNILKSKLICGSCMHVLKPNDRFTTYSCSYTRIAPDCDCYKFKVQSSEVEPYILQLIQKQVKTLNKQSSDLPLSELTSGEKIERLENTKRCIYEQFVLGSIDADEFKGEKHKIDVQLDHLKQIMQKSNEDSKIAIANESLLKIINGSGEIKILTRQLVDALIDKVYVYPDKSMKIIWKIPTMV